MGKLHRRLETAFEIQFWSWGFFCSESLQNPIDLFWGAKYLPTAGSKSVPLFISAVLGRYLELWGPPHHSTFAIMHVVSIYNHCGGPWQL